MNSVLLHSASVLVSNVFVSCLSSDPISGETGVLRSAFVGAGQEVQRSTAARGPLPETVGLRLPAAPAHAPAAHRRFHAHPPAQRRRAVLGQSSAQYVQSEHLHVQLPETPASQ